MSGGGEDDSANQLMDEQIQLQKQTIQEKVKALTNARMAIIKGQDAQQFSNPDNPNPPAQIIQ